MKKTIYLLANSFTFVLVLVVNFIYGSGMWGSATVGEISSQYPTLITPAGYAFSIWGLIYLLLIAFVIYQWYEWKNGDCTHSLKPSGWWFFSANIANSMWLVFWTNEWMGLSLLAMAWLLFSLIRLVIALKLETWNAPLRIILFVWWPICFYLGWVVLASVLNVAVYLVSIQWSGWGITPVIWSAVAMVLGLAVYLLLIYYRNMREAGFVGAWGFIAIAVNTGENLILWMALSAAAILLVAGLFHGIKNYYYTPTEKWKRGEL